MSRIAVVDNEKLKEHTLKVHIQNLCPVNRGGTECITISDDGKLLIDEVTCIGCGICVKPSMDAIKIINLPEALNSDPIHRYGENEFMLYSLPTPLFGKVIGLLGINGIGKSTALKILAGVVKPNFGDWKDSDPGYDRLIEYFKGSEAQKYFEKVRDGEIVVSYKPQQVDLIPHSAKGTVRELLHKVDEKDAFVEVVDELSLTHVLDRDIGQVSGGELQRVAIAACVLKKANVYLFDEPTSYLDIKQRIKVGKFIQKMAEDPEVAVMVIEHDLIIMDYMTDYVHIMYGKEGGYGIVSNLKSSREGINAYLEGFLVDDNIRFRDHAIKFEERAPETKKERSEMVSWEGVSKKLGTFSLSGEKGRISKHDVIGVLGENGIGKTSFVKILAGVEELDSGNVNGEVTVSYKPQYIDTNSDELVMSVLAEAFQKYENQIIEPLSLVGLAEKPINALSGGQLQRVAVALALSKKADLYLLDEPSAYLDVEQRLIVSRVIGKIMEQRGTSCLVVDHDLLFLDYLSNRLMVFDGQPAVRGSVQGPFNMEEGMTHFLKEIEVTLRRDKDSHRPRVNKKDSVKDREAKSSGKYYYS